MIASVLMILSTSISSRELWSFMRQPTNGLSYATEVSSAYTFGSPDHTNVTHRLVKDTCSSVETLFEAYYERVFFSSEGRSNDWDVATYGPRATQESELNLVSFGRTNGGERIGFRYLPESRHMPDTRRLVETNLPRAWPAMVRDLLEKEQPLLERGETWWPSNSARNVRWICSGFDLSDPPEAFSWSAGTWPRKRHMLGNLVPINAFDSGLDDLEWPATDRNGGPILMRQWLDRIIMRDEDVREAFSNETKYSYLEKSVTDEMAALYGNPTNAVYGEFTRRLVPDEYVTAMDLAVSTNSTTAENHVTDGNMAAFKSWSPWSDQHCASLSNGRYYREVKMKGDVYLQPKSEVVLWLYDDETGSTGPLNVTIDSPGQFDEIYAEDYGGRVGTYEFTVSNGVCIAGEWKWVNQVGYPLSGLEITVTTNSVTKAVSYLASTARILAAHDRTVEFPYYEEAEWSTNVFVCASNRLEEWSVDVQHEMNGNGSRTFSITYEPGSREFNIDPPIRLATLGYTDGTPVYTNTVEREAIFHDYDTAWFSGSMDDDHAHASIRLDADRKQLTTVSFNVSTMDFVELPEGLEDLPGIFTSILSVYDDESDTFTFGFHFDEYWQDLLFTTRMEGGIRNNLDITTLVGSGGIVVRRSCRMEMSEQPAPSHPFWRKLFPAGCGPGLLGSSRIKSVKDLFGSSVVFDRPNDYFDMAQVPPFSYSDITHNYYSDHTASVDYCLTVNAKNSWDTTITFPTDYANHRWTVVEPRVRSIIPNVTNAIPSKVSELDLSGISDEEGVGTLSRGVITGNALPENGTPVYIAFQDGRCIDFYFYESSNQYHTVEIPFAVAFKFEAKAGANVNFRTKTKSAAATGLTSPLVVTDWDWHALKLERKNQ